MSHLHVAKGILLDNLALPLKEPARVPHGLTGHLSYRNLLKESPVGILMDVMTDPLCFSSTVTHRGFFFNSTSPIWQKRREKKCCKNYTGTSFFSPAKKINSTSLT